MQKHVVNAEIITPMTRREKNDGEYEKWNKQLGYHGGIFRRRGTTSARKVAELCTGTD